MMEGGAGVKLLAARVTDTAARASRVNGLAEPANALGAALKKIGLATQSAWSTGVPEEALANATPYLQAFGHAVLAWLWLDVTIASQRQPGPAHEGRMAAMRYFYAYELPKIGAWLGVVASREPLVREMREEWF